MRIHCILYFNSNSNGRENSLKITDKEAKDNSARKSPWKWLTKSPKKTKSEVSHREMLCLQAASDNGGSVLDYVRLHSITVEIIKIIHIFLIVQLRRAEKVILFFNTQDLLCRNLLWLYFVLKHIKEWRHCFNDWESKEIVFTGSIAPKQEDNRGCQSKIHFASLRCALS